MIKIEKNIDVAPITTFGIHAKAAAIAHYDTPDELCKLLADESLPKPLKHIGAGSNLLFTSDFPGTVLHCSRRGAYISKPVDGELYINASAGFVMDKLCLVTASRGYWGLENLSGIPGEVGSSAVQNVGAYGVEAGDLIKQVCTIDTTTLSERIFLNHEIEFGYRDSFFKRPENKGRYIITEVTFSLSLNPAPKLGYAHLEQFVNERRNGGELTPTLVRDAIIEMRNEKLPDPSIIGSAGSFFKNPVVDVATFHRICRENPDVDVPHYLLPDDMVKIPAAWFIDRAGFKGRSMGGAAVWQKQPLVIVNANGEATSADVVDLEQEIISTIRKRFGVTLSPEVEHI